ncbi:nuclease-related domain-containing protein [Arthrobacter sp. zg-Y238]|uniref:nuclease-related domain-containing protein n=1 Tax=Arthrobacter sp. zg-Y238 TaxID=2964614 RepID=UPI00210335F6|nr:nuclease-related domain-containing protein [Arthrobacter sp. zg-Y238]MCQ1954127.1 NERD domain-containing protein [Arthrobacter sp. zg-Y238]
MPEEPDFQDGHLAEQAVWNALHAQLRDDVVLAHSVQLRRCRAEHEIDILVLWPGIGVAVLEVKGGRVSVDNSQWYQSDRTGKRQMESPVAQAQSAQHAFKDWIGSRLGTPLTSRITYMACFPYSDVSADWEMAGTPRSLVVDQGELANNCAAKIRGAIQTEGQGSVPLSPKYLERILPHLSGDLTPAGRPGLDAAELEYH